MRDVFEGTDEDGRGLSYAAAEAEVQWETEGDEAAHREHVRRVGEQHGFPIPTWTPVIPERES